MINRRERLTPPPEAETLESVKPRTPISLSLHIRDSSIAHVVTVASELSPLFRSDTQGEIVTLLVLSPDRAFTVAELARATSAPYASAHREVQRLLRTGVAKARRVGQHHQVSVNLDSPAAAPLRELALLSYGPAVVIPEALRGVGGIAEAYLYGSWAARRAGEPGTPPKDIDVLIVGDPSRAEVYEAVGEASRRLGREVNARIVTPDAWRSSQDPFLATVRARPLARLPLKGPA